LKGEEIDVIEVFKMFYDYREIDIFTPDGSDKGLRGHI